MTAAGEVVLAVAAMVVVGWEGAVWGAGRGAEMGASVELKEVGAPGAATGGTVAVETAMVVVGVMGAAAMAAEEWVVERVVEERVMAVAAMAAAAMVEAAKAEGGKAGVSVAVGRTGEKVDMVAPAGAMVARRGLAVVKAVGVVGAGAVTGVGRAAARAEVMVVGWAAAVRVAATAAGMAAGMAAAVRGVAWGGV